MQCIIIYIIIYVYTHTSQQITTSLTPHELLEGVKDIETDLGRETTFRNGPRVIDLDILTYGDESVDTEDLQVPHPRIQERDFVLGPLSDMDPDLKVAGLGGKTVKEVSCRWSICLNALPTCLH